MPVEVMIFLRTGWEDPLAELNERLRELFAIGCAGERELIDMVATHFGLTRAEMVGARGASGIAQARHIAMYLCRRELGTSAAGLGRLFRRDHSSVVHAARKVAARIAENPAFAAEVAALAARWRERCT
jgi:chromosomal replication initiation ATPase DnaA